MALYDANPLMQLFQHGVDNAQQVNEVRLQQPRPADVFLDRLRQAKQDQLHKSQLDLNTAFKQNQMLVNQEKADAMQQNADSSRMRATTYTQVQPLLAQARKDALDLRERLATDPGNPKNLALLANAEAKVELYAKMMSKLSAQTNVINGEWGIGENGEIDPNSLEARLKESQTNRNNRPPVADQPHGQYGLTDAQFSTLSKRAISIEKSPAFMVRAMNARKTGAEPPNAFLEALTEAGLYHAGSPAPPPKPFVNPPPGQGAAPKPGGTKFVYANKDNDPAGTVSPDGKLVVDPTGQGWIPNPSVPPTGQ